MLKTISVYSPHSSVKDVASFLQYFRLTPISNDYKFEWNPISPDYLFVADSYIHKPEVFKKLKELRNRAKIKVCFCSEAFSPDFNLFDYNIGWDLDLNFGDRYCLLPPAHEYVASRFSSCRENDIKNIDSAKKVLQNKTRFCNFIYSNYKAHPMRDNLFFEISKYKKVDSLGKHLKNVKETIAGYYTMGKENIDFKAAYKFSIASENAIFPGYTSEKIYTSLFSHTVPIYWGDPEVARYINPKAFINVFDYKSFQELRDRIQEIDENDDLWCDMVAQPWHTSEQITAIQKRSTNYLDFFRHIFDQDIDVAKRIPEGTFPDMYRYRFYNGFKSKTKFYSEILKHKIDLLLK